jgi:WD40 repeat protein/tetratricopeptide (TPR) repeat protein
MKTVNSPHANPFPGLRPFRSDEHHLFFGREEQTAALLQLLRTNRFLAVVGTSGSGKSSLVRAGMIAELHGGTMTQAGSTWEVMILRPGGSPIENLARAFVDAELYDAEDPSTLPRLLATLNRSRFGLVEAMKQCELIQPGTNLLVVVDQFEELFRFRQQGVDSEETAAAFVNLLLTASEQAECPIYVTITMRSDYLGDCSEIPGLAEAVNEGEYLIPRLLRDQKRDAIEKPIGVGGARISPLLVQRLLNEVGDDTDQLPVLQHALMRMWSAWSSGTGDHRPIDFGDFEATGGLASALSNHADEIYDSLPDDRHRSACEKIFKTLTVKGDDNRGIRRPTRLAHLQAIANADRNTVTTVLDAFRGSGVTFLMPGMEVELDDRTVLDLSHESLMRGWQRLRGWVEEEAQSARVFRRLLDTARLWRDGKAGLFRDPDLQIALSWREQEAPNAEWAEQYGGHFETAVSFLESSAAEAEAERQAKEAARQRELEQAQELAESRKQRLLQQQRAAKRLRKLIAGLAVVAVIAGLACVAALVSRSEASRLAAVAEQEADNARQNEEKAKQSQQETKKALATVESQKAEVEGSLSKAEAAERLARAAEEEGRKLLYTTDMRLAPFVWRDDRSTSEQLRVLLAKHIPDNKEVSAGGPKPDLRGFEWHYYQHLLDSSATVFSGHAAALAAGAFASDGQLVTLDENGQVRRWGLSSQSEDTVSRRDLPGGPNAQLRVLSPNGRLAALAEGNKVHVFDTSSGKETFQIDSASNQFRRLIFSRDNDRLVIVDDKIRWCNALSGLVLAAVNQKFEPVYSIVLSADGLTLAVVGHGGSGQLFSAFRLDATAKKVSLLAKEVGPGGTLYASALSPDGQRIAFGGKLSGILFVYDTATGRSIAQHGSAHASPASAMAFSGDGARLATADAEGTIKIWADAQKLNSKSTAFLTLKGHQGAINSVGFSSDGKRLVTTSADKTARVWDLENAGAAIRPLEHSGLSWVARFSPDGQLIAAAAGKSVRLWDAASGRLVRELSAGDSKGSIYSVAFSPTDNRLLAVGYGGQQDVSHIALWDIDAGTERARLPGATDLPNFQVDEMNGAVGALAFSPDGKYLVAGFGSKNWFMGQSLPNPIKVWEVATRRLIRRLNGHTGYCVSLNFSRDGLLLASGSRDGSAIIWSTQTWNKAQTLQNPDKDSLFGQGLRGMVENVEFSPDGKTLAVASREGNVQLWNVAGGKLLETLKGHSSAVEAVVFSPDGRTLASGSGDHTVRLWNVETGRQLMQLDSGGVELGAVQALAFSPDGNHLLAAGRSRTAFWSAAPIVWNDPDRAAAKLRLLLQSAADFRSRVRMLSENLRLHEALAKLDAKDVRVQAALAATQANWHASRQAWPEAVKAFDRLAAADPTNPEGWLRTSGLLRLATALLHQNRPRDAAAVLKGGAKHRQQDGLSDAIDRVALGVIHSSVDGAIQVTESLPGSPAARSRLRPRDVIVKVNDTELTRESLDKFIQLLEGEPGTKVRLTVRHAGSEKPEVIELTRERFVNDAATGELLHPLQVTLNERIAKERRHPGLLELRAELAGQWSDAKAQVADYTAAIGALSQQKAEATGADLKRLYGRRGNAYVRLQKWQDAAADFGDAVTSKTTDEELLANQARAQAGVLLRAPKWTALSPVKMVSRGGATLTKLADDSILASGTNPRNDAYEITAPVDVGVITTLLLEAIPDPSLPGGGVGRGGEGSMAMSEIRLTRLTAPDGKPAPVPFDTATADINPLEAGRAIDGRDDTHITVYPEYASLHRLVLRLREPLKISENERLLIQLEFFDKTYATHGLGRFRLSVSDDPNAFDREQKLFATMKTADPWARLALAYRQAGDQKAIDALVARRPQAALSIGDLFAADSDWPRAVEVYSRGIMANTTDADLLSKRARAYEAQKKWDAAAADWSRTATSNPDQAKLLAEFARRLAAGDQVPLAKAQFEKSQALYERMLEADPEKNDVVAPELAQLLLDKHENENPGRWVVLKLLEAKSELGATLSILPDNSILASGPTPQNDRYRVAVTVGTDSDLAAVRLDALGHASLPGNGPGRYPGRSPGNVYRGTFMQASWKVTATLPNRKDPIPLDFDQASADHQMPGFPVTSQGHWNITESGEGQNCTAVWSLSKPVSLAAGTKMTFEMQFGGVGAENLGHFRLSATSDRASFERKQTRFAAMQPKDPWAKLAAAYAVNGSNEEATQYFSKALQRADGYDTKKPIVELAAHFDEVVSALAQQQPGGAHLQLALARNFAERGKRRLADNQPAKAQAELEKARGNLRRLWEGPKWAVLTPTELKSQGGETLTVEQDGSIFVTGPNPNRAVYTLKLQTDLPTLTAIRLETIPDARLPDGGAGRYGNGNFHVAEFTAALTPNPSPPGRGVRGEGQADAKPIPIEFGSAMADFSEDQTDPPKSIDGDPRTRWDTHPRMKEPHWAVFVLKSPAQMDGGSLIITLDSGISQWGYHGLGRFRLSVTDDADLTRAILRNDLKGSEFVDLSIALAKAHAKQGHIDEAVASFTEALDLATDGVAKAKIITEAATLEGVLEKLVEQAAGDGQFQAELARHFAERGNAPLAEAARAKARALFEQKLAKEPENSALAAELAEVLLIDTRAKTSAGGATLPERFVRLGRQNEVNGIDLVDYAADGATEPAEIEGQQCRLVQTGSRGWGHAYFVIEKGFKWPPTMNVQVEIEYWADSSGSFQIQYDSHDDSYNRSQAPVQLDGSRGWKTARFALKGARFANSQNGRADFRFLVTTAGRFYLKRVSIRRLSAREQERLVAMKLTDPRAKLAIAYHVIGDQSALDKLLEHHPAAIAGIGDLYQSAGRTREAVSYLVKASAANPKDTSLSLMVAALQAWFGQEKELAATRQRIRAFAKDTKEAMTAERAAKACSILPSTDKAELEAALALIRAGMKLGKVGESDEWNLLALGMAEYRNGNYVAADEALLAVAKAAPNNQQLRGISAFYRAMSLLRQGKKDEAWRRAISAAAKMKPLPADETNPLAGGASDNDLILWLAFKEARTLLKIDLSPIELLEQARNDEVKTLGAGHPTTLATTNQLIDAYLAGSRTRDAVPLLATVSSANPSDTLLSLKVAALQAWFGQDKELAATLQRIRAYARDASDADTPEQAAKACSIRASTNKGELDAALALARKAVELHKDEQFREWRLLALGMAEYRSGNYAAAVEALLAAEKAGSNNAMAKGIAAFYRAMSLFRQGKPDEARKLAIAAAAQMKPLPIDEQNPLPNDAYPWDDLILWLAYKEAKAMIRFDEAVGAPMKLALEGQLAEAAKAYAKALADAPDQKTKARIMEELAQFGDVLTAVYVLNNDWKNAAGGRLSRRHRPPKSRTRVAARGRYLPTRLPDGYNSRVRVGKG